MGRLIQKLQYTVEMLRSVRHAADLPGSILFSLCRNRPTTGSSVYAQFVRRVFPHVLLHPRLLRPFSIVLEPGNIDQAVIYEELFLEHVYNLSLLQFEPDVIVDCGGFEGYFTLQALARFPSARSVVFEPHPANFAAMSANFARNRVDVDSRREAVSNRSGEMLFRGRGVGGCLVQEGDDAVAVQTTVKVSNLSQVITALAPNRLLLKLDVEGEEETILPEVLSVLPPTSALFFEWHHGPDRFAAIQNLLTRHGLTVRRCRTRALEGGGGYIDAFAQRL